MGTDPIGDHDKCGPVHFPSFPLPYRRFAFVVSCILNSCVTAGIVSQGLKILYQIAYENNIFYIIIL